ASLSAEGWLELRPQHAQIATSPNRIPFTVTDGKDTVGGEIVVTVTRDPRAPRWKTDPTKPLRFTAKAGVSFTGNLKEYAIDLDGIALTFSRNPAVGPAWLKVEPDGRMHGLPLEENAGENAFV